MSNDKKFFVRNSILRDLIPIGLALIFFVLRMLLASKYAFIVVAIILLIIFIHIDSRSAKKGFFSEGASRRRIRKARDKENLSYLLGRRLLLIRSWDYYELRNKNIIITYDFEKKFMKIYDRETKGRYSVIDWAKQIKSVYANEYTLEDTFYYLCSIFCESFTYYGVMSNLSKFYDPVETLPPITERKQNRIIEAIEQLDINNATEKEITSLPGVNIVAAKKVIHYRDLHGGFKTREEFFKVAKIKEHYIEKIKPQIVVRDYIKKEEKAEEERILDI